MASTRKTPGAPIGNNNAGKNKIWSDAIRKAIVQGNNLDKLAQALISKAQEGDVAALKEIGDRLEGKVVQSVDATVDASVTVEIIRFGTNNAA